MTNKRCGGLGVFVINVKNRKHGPSKTAEDTKVGSSEIARIILVL